MQFEDLAILSVDFGVSCEARAVGWLDPAQAYATGRVPHGVFDALMTLSVNPWQPTATLGVHRCGFCVHTGGPGLVQKDDWSVRIGNRTLFVPGERVLYVAPVMVVHYIDAHGYKPPEEFVQAVLACPPMRGMAYMRMLHELGVRVAR